MRYLAIFVILFALLLPVSGAYAAGSVVGSIVPCGASTHMCGICDLVQLAQNLINIGIFITITLSAMTFAYAGFLYLSAAGNSGQVEKAQKTFTNVAIGLVIILGAWVGVDTLMKTVVDSGKFGPWNSLGCGQGLSA